MNDAVEHQDERANQTHPEHGVLAQPPPDEVAAADLGQPGEGEQKDGAQHHIS